MAGDRDSDREDDRIRPLLQHYHAPPPFPAESLWHDIQRSAQRERSSARRGRMLYLPIGWAATAAIMLLAVGIAAGAAISAGRQRDADSAPPIVDQTPTEPQETKLVIWL